MSATTPPSVQVLGLTISDATLAEAADELLQRAAAGTPTQVVFVHAHCANVAAGHAHYRRTLHRADLRYADGSGMRWAAAREGVQLRGNVNGTDLFPLLCDGAAAQGLPLALLGARPGVAERCAQRLQQQHPGLRVVWTHDGYFHDDATPALIESLNNSGARLLLVAMGVPMQELWLQAHAAQLQPPVRLAVGGLFDIAAGDIPRAPPWMRERGIEWLFRLLQEPLRLAGRSLLSHPWFVLRVLLRRRSRATAPAARHVPQQRPPTLHPNPKHEHEE